MAQNQNIIVVADKELKSFGRQLVHAITKSKVAKASLYSPKQYEDNEHQIAGSQHVIFIGENEVSRDFIPLVVDKHEVCGSIWGFDETKAVIYLDPEVSPSEADLKKRLEEVKEQAQRDQSAKSENEGLSFTDIAICAVFPGLVLSLVAFDWIFGKDETTELRYALGLAVFVQDGLEEFIKC